MKKALYVLAVVVSAGGGACAARTDESRAPQALTHAPPTTTTDDTEGGSCEQGLSITVNAGDAGSHKYFSGGRSWTVRQTQSVTFVNQTDSSLCIDILDSQGKNLGPNQPLSASGGSWNDACALAGGTTYTVTACFRDDCSKLCQQKDGTQDDPGVTDTIKGNLSVITSG
ncbi:hypothetical protein [Pyxidicoccus trucidator]|uniref:hypothetical protein n=1 Tax=Pyxidicoccus trucidator TaxID=2709662 RepID=UPI0013D96CB5|nr:hypothetical protein [Pyxidicoccus trucidator]